MNKYPTAKQTANKKSKLKLLDCVLSFDIETTTTDDAAFIYLWQFCENGDFIYGRYIEEFVDYLDEFAELNELNENKKAVIFVHNLSYEWQFIKHYFTIEKAFFMDSHDVLYFETPQYIFKCTYHLTNLSLRNWAKSINDIPVLKTSLEYKKIRYPWTPLTVEELEYAKNDVLIIYYGIKEKLKNDTLYSLPLTATGYVRRNFRNSCKNDKEWAEFYRSQQMDAKRYMLYRAAFFGGQVFLNPIFYNKIIRGVHSFDKASDYPYQLVAKEYPKDRGCYISDLDMFDFLTIIERGDLWVAKITFTNFKLNKYSYPFIQKYKCLHIENGRFESGRVISADMLQIVLTSIDFNSASLFYSFNILKIHEIIVHKKKGLLPKVFRNLCLKNYANKTKYKNDSEHIIEYKASKSDNNSAYGMTVTDMLRDAFELNEDLTVTVTRSSSLSVDEIQTKLDKFYKNKNNFLPYSIGVFCVAHARADLVEPIAEMKMDFVYCDTDCVKCFEDYSEYFTKINKNIYNYLSTLYSEEDFAPKDIKGVRHCIGAWECESPPGGYRFRGYGAKKYIVAENDKRTATVAGCSKQGILNYYRVKGKDPLIAFDELTEIPPTYSGRTSSTYIDEERVIYAEGRTITIPSCMLINEVPYTLAEIFDENKNALTISEEYKLDAILKEIDRRSEKCRD